MVNLRTLAERDLQYPIADWGFDVTLIGPDGVSDEIVGQVFSDSVRYLPDIGQETVVRSPWVFLRISDLRRVPAAGENWVVKTKTSVSGSIETFVLDPSRPPEPSYTLGSIRIFLKKAVQS